MLTRDRARWALASLVSIAILSAPAVWNGFPLLQWDTGGYIARWYEHSLVISRSTVYGLFLTAGSSLAFWPDIVAQSAVAAWVIALTLRAVGLGNRPWLFTGIVAALSVLTTLPWLTSILLTDIFCVAGVLGLWLLLMHADVLNRIERAGLVLLVAFSAATHSATLAVLGGLLIVGAAYAYFDRRRLPPRRLVNGAAALVLGVVMVYGGNYYIARQVAWTPGGIALSFGRMLQSGIVNKYLDAHCPDPYLRLCKYKDELPRDADEFFWGSPLFDKLGRFAGLNKEMKRIALGSLAEYPMLQFTSAVHDTLDQLVKVRTGEGVENVVWHTYGIIKDNLPQLVPAMEAARQQGRPDGLAHVFPEINKLHYPVALGAMALLPLIVLLAFFEALPFVYGEFAAMCIVALLGNAFVCGALSNPHDRYGARMVWIAALAVLMAIARLAERRRKPRVKPVPGAEPLFY
ncbi:MAG TPA: hypothetical protein VN655_06390 [Pseudolabrys sp.]|nr:hypothetical protein [Pseudolabrys sp.]